MTRAKKIAEEKMITQFWYDEIKERGYFNYWSDRQEFAQYICDCDTQVTYRRTMRYFFKNVYPNREFLEKYEY